MEYKEYKLGDICSYRNEKISVQEVLEDDYISTDNMAANKRGIVGSSNLPKSGRINKYYPNDILISNIRPYFKKIWFSTHKGGSSNDVLIFKANEQLVNARYLYYFLSQDVFFDYMMQTSKGTKMPRGDKHAIMNYKIALPDTSHQYKMVKLLDSIVDKITLNESIINTLEQIAQTLFKHWFIDFEFPNEQGQPYKSSGGGMVESELGMIPKGWKINILKNIVGVIDNRGKTPPLVDNDKRFPIIDVKALGGNSRVVNYDNCRKFVDQETYESWFRKGHPKKFDTLLSTVGSIGEMKLFYQNKGCIAQNVVALRSKDVSKIYIYELMQSMKKDLITYNIGSVQPSIKITHIIKKNVLIPDRDLLLKFDQVVGPIIDTVFSLDNEIQVLNNIRDTLLPKLLSGEIEIPDEMVVN